MSLDFQQKPKKKKKTEVPVHRSNRKHENDEIIYKTYSAQFSPKQRDKHKINSDKQTEEENSQKVTRKSLINANEFLCRQNEQLVDKFTELQEHSTKKINKLKEKINQLLKVNQEVVEVNKNISTQYQDLYSNYEQCRLQLESHKVCRGCEEYKTLLEKHTNDYAILKSSNKQLVEDMSMLKNVVYRLNVHLEHYQEKLRKHNIKTKPINLNPIPESANHLETITAENITYLSEDHLDHSHIPISWGPVNCHTLGPLLNAYQETISEKDDIIQSYEAQLSYFTGQLKEILDENEILHKKLTIDDECSAKLLIELDKHKNELKSTKDQNDLLIKKCALKQEKLEEVLKFYEQKVEQLQRDYNVVVEEFHKSRTEVATLKAKNKTLIDSQSGFKNERHDVIPISVHESSVNECKKWYEELKQQYEYEKSKLKENSELLNKQIAELTNKINSFKNEKEEFENKIKSSDKHIKKLEGKCLDLQHVFHEAQLSRSACRKQLHKAMNFAKELVAEQEALLKALHLRQHENKIVKQIGTDIATRMDSLKNQLKTVQRDAFNELSTVEQKILSQDSVIMSMKRQHEREVEKLKEIIKQKEDNLLLRDTNSSIPMPHYLLLRDRNRE